MIEWRTGRPPKSGYYIDPLTTIPVAAWCPMPEYRPPAEAESS